MRLESTGYSDAKRIMGYDGTLSAMVMRYTSGLWAIHHKDTGAKLTTPQFRTPKAALKHWEDQTNDR